MVSYAWGARKDLVTQFVNHLRSQEWGFDVWQDINGSKVVFCVIPSCLMV